MRRAACAAVMLWWIPSGLGGQTATPGLDHLTDAPGATMSYKLERTFLKVDVILLTLRVDPATAGAISDILTREPRHDRTSEERVVQAVVGAEEAIARLEFLRNIRLDQFLEGVEKDMARALRAGWFEQSAFEEVVDGLREWFGFLDERGIKKGDVLVYHVHGDELRTTYHRVGEDSAALDQTDVGARFVDVFWGGYLAPDTSFRKGLTRSLWADR